MKKANLLSGLKDNQLMARYAPLALGLVSLGYVFYSALIDLPPFLTNMVVFLAFFAGVSAFLHVTDKKFTMPLFLLYMGLFFLPFIWLWRGLEFDANILMGIFPFNDGMYYLNDALRMQFGLKAIIIPNGRPLYNGALAFLMRIFDGNVQIALALFCIGMAISIFLLALEIREVAGPIPAGMTTTILFYFSLPFSGRVHTESLGLTFGALALALLFKGIRRNSQLTLAIGALALSLALNIRAGAFFALPALVIWAWFNRKILGEKTPFLMLAAMLIGFLANMMLFNAIGINKEGAFSNFGNTLYGLAAGYKGWGYIFTIHPEFKNGTNVMPLALELIKENPALLLMGILYSYLDYFKPQEMFTLMTFWNQQSLISWILYIATWIGLYRLIRSRDKLHWSLMLYLFVGILSSVSFVPPIDTGVRALMATHPVNALLAGLAFFPLGDDQQKKFHTIDNPLPEFHTFFWALICVLGPIFVMNFPRATPALPLLNCPEGTEQISVLVSPGSYINVVNQGPPFGFIPEIRKEDIKKRLDDYHYRENHPYILTEFSSFERLVKKLKHGDTILIGLNLLELEIGEGPEEFIFLIVLADQVQNIGGVNNFCARLATEDRLQGNRFYFDKSVQDREWYGK